MNNETRNKQIALIHTQKKKAMLDDEIYIDILMNCAGVDSASRLVTQAQFSSVISALNQVLQSQGLPTMGKQQTILSPLAWSVLKRSQTILGSQADERLRGYLAKIGKKSLNDCTDCELRRIQGFLSSISRGGR